MFKRDRVSGAKLKRRLTFAGPPPARRTLLHQPPDDLEDSDFSQESVQSEHLPTAQRTERTQTLHKRARVTLA